MMLPAPNQKRQPDPAAGSLEVAPKSTQYKARHTDQRLFQFISVLQTGVAVGRGSLCDKAERVSARRSGGRT